MEQTNLKKHAEQAWLIELTTTPMKTYNEARIVDGILNRLPNRDLLGEYDKEHGVIIVTDDSGAYVTQLNTRPLVSDNNTLVNPIRVAVFNKNDLLKRYGLTKSVQYMEEDYDGSYNQIVGYFGAKKLPDNHVHIIYTFCQPDDNIYGQINKDVSLVILHQKLNSFGCVEKDDVNNPVEEFEPHEWMYQEYLEGSKYIYKFPEQEDFHLQLGWFVLRCNRYFKVKG